MKKGLTVCSILFLGSLSIVAQQHSSGSVHSNAPAGARAASTDRDKGKDRAADVGKGKKKGSKKHEPKHTKS